MAGGASERMRSSHGPTHKALVEVLGVPMLERHILRLLASGCRDIIVAHSEKESAIATYLNARGHALAAARGAILQSIQESQPLGTIGVAGQLNCHSDALLVINVDNLTTLDLNALVRHHRHRGAPLTIATHPESFRMPFGEVIIQDGDIDAYIEKPLQAFQVSSGLYVLSPKARALLTKSCRTDIPELLTLLHERGEQIAAFQHHAPWIDINDAAALSQAERLIMSDLPAFEHWTCEPDTKRTALLLHGSQGILLERRPAAVDSSPTGWSLPWRSDSRDDGAPHNQAARRCNMAPTWPRLCPEFLTTFDELDMSCGQLIRYDVFAAAVDGVTPGSEMARERRWFSPEHLRSEDAWSPVVGRALAALRSSVS